MDSNTYSINGKEYEVKPFGINQLQILKKFVSDNRYMDLGTDENGNIKITFNDILNHYVDAGKIGELLSIIISPVDKDWNKKDMVTTQADIEESNMNVDFIAGMMQDFLSSLPNWKSFLRKYLGGLIPVMTMEQAAVESE